MAGSNHMPTTRQCWYSGVVLLPQGHWSDTPASGAGCFWLRLRSQCWADADQYRWSVQHGVDSLCTLQRLSAQTKGPTLRESENQCRKAGMLNWQHGTWMTSSHLAPMESKLWMSQTLPVPRLQGLSARQIPVKCHKYTMACLGVSSHALLRLPAPAHTAKARSIHIKKDRFCARLVHSGASSAQAEQAQTPVSSLGKHFAIMAAIGPLLLAAPAYAQLEALGPAALAESVTVPLLLSTLAGGAVYAALQSKDAKAVLAQVAEGAR